MKIVLIHPASDQVVKNPTALRDQDFGIHPPLGLMCLAAMFRSKPEHQLTILDYQLPAWQSKARNRFISNYRPDIVGIYTTSWTLVEVLRIVAEVRRQHPQAIIVAGGPHVRVFPRETMELSGIDIGVIGEGEETFQEVVTTLNRGEDLAQVSGLVYRKDNDIILTKPRAPGSNLDRFPIPDHRELPPGRYANLLGGNGRFMTIESSRGCPYRCVYCYNDATPYRERTIDSIITTIEILTNQGVTDIYFIDDTFNLKPERPLALATEIKRRSIKVRWSFRGRAEHLDASYCRYLAKAGCTRIQMGVESGSTSVLHATDKHLRLDEVVTAFSAARRAGIKTVGYFMFGLPNEGPEQIEETIKFALALDPDYALFGITMLLPGTRLYREVLANGGVRSDVWREFVCNPSSGFTPPNYESLVPSSELKRWRTSAQLRFYLRPRSISRRLRSLRSVQDLRALVLGSRVWIRSVGFRS